MTVVVPGPLPIPIPLPGHPPQPLDIPIPDNPIPIIARGAAHTWHQVWGWVHDTAAPAAEAIASTIASELQKIIPVIEAYVGQEMKALSSFINDVSAFASEGITILSDSLSGAWVAAQDVANVLWETEGALYSVYNDVYNRVIPGLEASIWGALDYAYNIAHEVGLDVEQWTMNHVLNPVLEELIKLNQDIITYVDAKAEAVIHGLENIIADVDADLLARLGLVAGIATAVATWVEECGVPLCDTMGPNTDLFKLFKAFEAAGILALLMEIGNMTEGDVEARLRELAGKAQGIVSAFESTFVGGGGDLHDFALSLL